MRCTELAATRKNGRLRRRQRGRRADVRRRGARRERGRAGAAVRRSRRASCSTQLLGEIGLERADVFIANVLKCRPPGNRDPQPLEIENCQEYLHRQVELIQPTRDLHARQLLDEAAARRPDWDHALARAARGADARPPRGAALPDLPSRRRALHATDARDPARGLPAVARAARAGRARAAADAGRRRSSRCPRIPRQATASPSSRRRRPGERRAGCLAMSASPTSCGPF